MLRIVAFLTLLPLSAVADGFWVEVRRPGITGYRQAMAEGRVLYEQQKLREALDAFGRAARSLPDEPEGHLWRGNVLFELDRHREAVDAWDRARELEPRLLELGPHSFQMAIALSKLLDYRRSIAEYERMIPRLGAADGDEFRAIVFSNCAESMMALGPDHLDDAVRYYRRSLDQVATYRLAHWGLAVALDRQGSEVEAREEARRAIEGDEAMTSLVNGGVFFVPHYESHWYRAMGLEALGQHEGAVAEWRAYLATGGADGPWRALAERHVGRPAPPPPPAARPRRPRGRP